MQKGGMGQQKDSGSRLERVPGPQGLYAGRNMRASMKGTYDQGSPLEQGPVKPGSTALTSGRAGQTTLGRRSLLGGGEA